MTTTGRTIVTTGVLTLGAALLTFALPRADPSGATTLVGLLLVASALAGVVLSANGRERTAAAVLLCAAAAVVTVAAGEDTTATVVDRDLRTGVLPLALALVAAALIRPSPLAALAALGGILAGPARLLVYDPFLDPHCPGCTPGELVVWPAPHLATALHTIGVAATIGAVLLALLAGRSAGELWLVLACLMVYAADPADHRAILVGALVGAVWSARTTTTTRRRLRSVRRLLQALDEGDDLTTVLRRALADETLVVAFPVGGTFLDRTGAVVSPSPGRAVTDVVIDGGLAARLHHSPSTRPPQLSAALDAPMRLALGNEHLTARLAAQVDELSRARVEVVESGVRERRALERDLHDGVQQDLLALGLDLRVAASACGLDDPRRPVLERAVTEVHATLDEVRDISHGVYPPLLATRGLAAAVTSLARRATTPLEVGALPQQRFTDAIERAAFSVVAEAVDRGATWVDLSVDGDRLVVRATGAGNGVDGILPDLVAALSGEIDLGSPDVTAVLPCG